MKKKDKPIKLIQTKSMVCISVTTSFRFAIKSINSLAIRQFELRAIANNHYKILK